MEDIGGGHYGARFGASAVQLQMVWCPSYSAFSDIWGMCRVAGGRLEDTLGLGKCISAENALVSVLLLGQHIFTNKTIQRLMEEPEPSFESANQSPAAVQCSEDIFTIRENMGEEFRSWSFQFEYTWSSPGPSLSPPP